MTGKDFPSCPEQPTQSHCAPASCIVPADDEHNPQCSASLASKLLTNIEAQTEFTVEDLEVALPPEEVNNSEPPHSPYSLNDGFLLRIKLHLF